jgi:crotonobetainyl-CoA:carnitine CoA-transferase CaiB-like acyl-CoA transferase
MESEEMATNFLKEMDWYTIDMSKITQEFINQVEESFGKFFLTHTKSELYEGGLKRGIDVYPVNNVEDITQDPQLQERGFWIDIDHDELGDKIRYPGVPAKVSSSLYQTRSRAPLIGEHNEEIYLQELGFSKGQLVMLKQANII